MADGHKEKVYSTLDTKTDNVSAVKVVLTRVVRFFVKKMDDSKHDMMSN